jgi:hypothetical protein
MIQTDCFVVFLTPLVKTNYTTVSQALTMAARAIEEFYNRPQDIEWAIDEDDTLFILQSRPITTLESTGALSFLPPGEGFWTFDPTHFPRPASPWLRDNYGFQYAAHNSRRTGCMIKDIKFRFVHQFCYTQPDFSPPSEALERAATAYWEKKLYEDDYREFTDFFRPECEALQDELQSVNPSSLSHRTLGTYVARCFDLTAEFWKRHHTYTFPTFVSLSVVLFQIEHDLANTLFLNELNRLSSVTI